jgi:hypothetical protein
MIPIDKEYPFASVTTTLNYIGTSQSLTSSGAFTEENDTKSQRDQHRSTRTTRTNDVASSHHPTDAIPPAEVANGVNVERFGDCAIRICQGVEAGQRFIIWDDLVNVLKQAGLAQPFLSCKLLLVWFLRRLSMYNILTDRSIEEFVCDRDRRHKQMVEGQASGINHQNNIGEAVLLARCLDATDVDVFCDILTWFVSNFYNSNSNEETHISRIIYGLWHVQNRHLLTDETAAAYRTWKEEYKSAPHGQHKLKADMFVLYDYIAVQRKAAMAAQPVHNTDSALSSSQNQNTSYYGGVGQQRRGVPGNHTIALANGRASTPRPPMHHQHKLPPLHPRVMRTHTVYMLPPGVIVPKNSTHTPLGSNIAVSGGSESATDVASWLIALRGSRDERATLM